VKTERFPHELPGVSKLGRAKAGLLMQGFKSVKADEFERIFFVKNKNPTPFPQKQLF
jgi:hypothetical protein